MPHADTCLLTKNLPRGFPEFVAFVGAANVDVGRREISRETKWLDFETRTGDLYVCGCLSVLSVDFVSVSVPCSVILFTRNPFV